MDIEGYREKGDIYKYVIKLLTILSLFLAYLANQIKNSIRMTLQEYCQNQAGQHNRFQLESIQLRVVSGTIFYKHRVEDQGLGGDEEDFHDQVVELDEGMDTED